MENAKIKKLEPKEWLDRVIERSRKHLSFVCTQRLFKAPR